MDITWRLPPELPNPRSVDLRGPRIEGRRAEQGVWMEESTSYHTYGLPTPGYPGFHHEVGHCKSHVQDDLGPEASQQDWSDFKTLREQLSWWEETRYTLGHPMVSSTSYGTRQEKPTSKKSGPGWKGQKRSILLPCKHQS